jgi:dihydrofolate synthase / folylpolyglutamate synthase
MMGAKDARGFLTPFASLARHLVAVPVPATHETPMAPARLVDIADALKIPAIEAAGLPQALALAERITPGPKRVLICGSLYLAGHVLALDAGRGAVTGRT